MTENKSRIVRLWFAVLFACFPLFLSTPAAARPRDEVMAGAFRCAAIGEMRLWLDCFYGAAQPVRAALALPPAPPAQVKLVSAPPSGRVTSTDITIRDGVMASAIGCPNMSEDRAWLNCYYAAAEAARVRVGLATSVPVKASAPTPTPADISFGMPQPVAQSTSRVAARMTSYKFDRYGIFTSTLDSGQVWQQVSGDSSFARWTKAPGNYRVHISRGALGSYNFQVQDNPGMFKVRRIK